MHPLKPSNPAAGFPQRDGGRQGGRPRKDAPQHYHGRPQMECLGCSHLRAATETREAWCDVLQRFARPCPVRAREQAHAEKPLPPLDEYWV